MFDEPFVRGRSLVHGLDPRVRLGVAAFFSVATALIRGHAAASAALVLAGLMLALSRPPLGVLVRRLAMVNLFILFLWVIVPVTMPGPSVWSLGFLNISQAGLDLAGLVTLKSNAILLAFLALVATMDFPTMGHALQRLGVPAKLVFLLLFSYRYVHVIAEEWDRLRTAARLRGFVPVTSLHTYCVIGNLLGMVLINSFDRSQRVYQAMVLRGFSGRFATVARFRTQGRDVAFAACGVAAVVMLVVLDFFPELLRA